MTKEFSWYSRSGWQVGTGTPASIDPLTQIWTISVWLTLTCTYVCKLSNETKTILSDISWAVKFAYLMNDDIQGGSGSAPFTETAYRIKYFKHKAKEINQGTSTV